MYNNNLSWQNRSKWICQFINHNTYLEVTNKSNKLFFFSFKLFRKGKRTSFEKFFFERPITRRIICFLGPRIRRKKKDQQGQVKPIQLPKIEKVSKPGILKAALRLCQYRIRVYLRQKTYWFMGILLPVIILLIILPGYNEKLTKLKLYSFEKR